MTGNMASSENSVSGSRNRNDSEAEIVDRPTFIRIESTKALPISHSRKQLK